MHPDHGLEALFCPGARRQGVGAGPSIAPKNVEFGFLLCKDCRRVLDRLNIVEIQPQGFENTRCLGGRTSFANSTNGFLCSILRRHWNELSQKARWREIPFLRAHQRSRCHINRSTSTVQHLAQLVSNPCITTSDNEDPASLWRDVDLGKGRRGRKPLVA